MNRKLRIVLGLTVLIESSFVASAGAQCYDPMDYMRWSEELFPPAGVPLPSLVRGRFGYSISEASGLQILDIDLERGLTLIGSVDTPGIPSTMFLDGNLAVISEGTAGLQIIDVASAESPRIVGSFNAGGITRSAAWAGDILYAMNDPQGLQILDISNISAPVLRGVHPLGLSSHGGLRVIGDFVLTFPGWGEDKIFDVSNPDTPYVAGYLSSGILGSKTSEVVGDRLLVFGPNYPGGHLPVYWQISSIDISALPFTVLKSDYEFSTTLSGWYVANQAIYVNSAGITRVLDTSNPDQIRTVGAAITESGGNIVSIEEALLTPYSSASQWRYRVIPLIVTDFPTPIGAETVSGKVERMIVRDQKVYGTKGTGFSIFDLSDPADPNLLYAVGVQSANYRRTSVEVVGNRMFLTDSNGLLELYDVSNASSPVSLGPIPGIGSAVDLAAREGYLFVIESDGTLYVFDAETAGVPPLISRIEFEGQAGRIDVFDRQAVLTTSAAGVAKVFVLDVTNSAEPITIGHLDLPGVNSGSIDVTERAVFIYDGSKGAQIVDLSIPESPRHASQVSLGAYAGEPIAWGDQLIIHSGMGLSFYDVSDLNSPRPAGGMAGTSFSGAVVVGDYLCVAGSGFTSSLGFQVYGPYCGSSVGVDPMAVPTYDRTFQIAPNPATVSTAIQFTNETDRLVQIDIHDVLGRKIRSLHQGMLGAGSVRLPWDCRNDEGASCASGVYFVKIQSGNEKHIERVSVLR